MIALFNTDLPLWQNFKPSVPLRIVAGHVRGDGHGTIGRFEDDAHAERVLRQAGFVPMAMTPPDGSEGWVRATPILQTLFEHARVINPDKSPMVFRVTAIRHGCVHYRPHNGGGCEHTPCERFHLVIKRILRRGRGSDKSS